MHSIANFVQAGFWLAMFAAWGFYNTRLMAWVEAKVARPVFNTNPARSASIIYRVLACVLLYLSRQRLRRGAEGDVRTDRRDPGD